MGPHPLPRGHPGPRRLHPPARLAPPARPGAVGEAAAGAALASELGCPACHRLGDLAAKPVAPGLEGEGSRVRRTWLARFLQAPAVIHPLGYEPLTRSRMPDFRLTADEVADPTDYLMARRWPGVEWQPEPPTPEVVARGREYACRACHVREGSGGRAGPDLATVGERLTPGWRARFIQDPQALDPRSPMPNLGVGEAEARAIARYLAADAPVEPDPPRRPADGARGAALFRNLGFPGCHPGDAPPAPGGPDLSHAGDKFQPGSLTRFLARPGRVRPGRTARMPDFGLGEPEVRALVAFLMGLRDPAAPTLPERLRFTGRLSAASVEAGRHLASPDFLSCGSCHVGGAPPDASPEDWAPDLALSGQRLQPDWIVRWLLDPQRLAPGIAMPSLFADETSGPEDILEGDEERQVLALRDYILSLGGAGSAANPRPDAAPR